MRWLYHLLRADEVLSDPYTPPSLAAEGFIHCSYQPLVLKSAQLYFPRDCVLHVLQIDPRLLDVALRVANTPRGEMPHIHGPLRAAAIASTLTLEQIVAAPDTIPIR